MPYYGYILPVEVAHKLYQKDCQNDITLEDFVKRLTNRSESTFRFAIKYAISQDGGHVFFGYNIAINSDEFRPVEHPKDILDLSAIEYVNHVFSSFGLDSEKALVYAGSVYKIGSCQKLS